MKRLFLAVAVSAAGGSVALAQPAPMQPTQPTPPQIVLPQQPPTVLPVRPPEGPLTTPPLPGPPVGFQPTTDAPATGPGLPIYKSGGLVVGLYGQYPYDTGNWLLGGTDGTTRQSGAFMMTFPPSAGVVGSAPRGGLFHGRHRGR
ncbi:MAG: hypothetical protein K2V38_03795 [Gemmataceae bacterium]|nr:hypothetical protein [Gemmataceae bacterium]